MQYFIKVSRPSRHGSVHFIFYSYCREFEAICWLSRFASRHSADITIETLPTWDEGCSVQRITALKAGLQGKAGQGGAPQGDHWGSRGLTRRSARGAGGHQPQLRLLRRPGLAVGGVPLSRDAGPPLVQTPGLLGPHQGGGGAPGHPQAGGGGGAGVVRGVAPRPV